MTLTQYLMAALGKGMFVSDSDLVLMARIIEREVSGLPATGDQSSSVSQAKAQVENLALTLEEALQEGAAMAAINLAEERQANRFFSTAI